MKHIKTSYKCIAALLCLCMLLPLAACGETKQSQREIFAMDTIMTLTAYGNQREAGLDAAQSIIQAMDASLDPELETSTTYAINHANGANVSISGQVAKMLSCAYDVYKKSNGALDLSLYPVIKRWGFVDGHYYVPTDEELASDLALRELLLPGNGGQINDYLVDGMTKDVQGELEAMAGVNLVSSIQHEMNSADMSTPEKIRKLINDVAIAMKTDATHYSRMALDTEYADEVVVLMDAGKARDLSNSEAMLPDAARLNVEARIIPIYGGLPTPITEQQFNAGRGQSGTAYGAGTTPVAMGKAKPDMIIMDAKYFEIRPFIDEWKMTTSYNGAGDFRNYHCLYKGAMGFKPWKNAVRVYSA